MCPFVILGALPMQRHMPDLIKEGVKAFVVLNEAWELYITPTDLRARGMEALHIPIVDYLYAPR